jgi:hypothetical protein
MQGRCDLHAERKRFRAGTPAGVDSERADLLMAQGEHGTDSTSMSFAE